MIAISFVLLAALPRWLGIADPAWRRFLLTNGWMLGASAVWRRFRPLDPIDWQLTSAGKPTFGLSIALPILALIATFVSPGSKLTTGLVRPFDYAAISTLGPLAEEFFFRGICLGFLIRKTDSRWIASILVSLLFVLMHLPELGEGIGLFLISVVLCAIAINTRSLFWPTLIHCGWNLCNVAWLAPASAARSTVVLMISAALLVLSAYARLLGVKAK